MQVGCTLVGRRKEEKKGREMERRKGGTTKAGYAIVAAIGKLQSRGSQVLGERYMHEAAPDQQSAEVGTKSGTKKPTAVSELGQQPKGHTL
jgi:hypothetical protein